MITIIAAVSTNGVIGKNGKIPWRLKSDIDHFKNVTTGQTVIMGRTTWESLDLKFRPLPQRRNIVLSRQQGFFARGAEVVLSLEEALALTENDEQVFIIGGAQVYREAMYRAERLLITHVHTVVGGGTAFFPTIDPKEWSLVSRTQQVRGQDDTDNSAISDYSPSLRYIELANVRGIKQLQEYRLIRQRGHCPFCKEQLPLYHDNPILWEGAHWVLTESDYPYEGTEAHFLLILKEHAESVGSLTEAAWRELHSAVWRLEVAREFPGGGICIRSGSPLISGASIKHLHAHIITPKKGAEPIKFHLGKGKR